MKHIDIFYENRKITLWEFTPQFEDMVENLKIDEPFTHKCNNRTFKILSTFFDTGKNKEINFEHTDLDKLFNDFKSYFTYIEAAGGLVRNKNNELLVIHRLGVPDLPKGKKEEKETCRETAYREVSEECGISGMELLDEAEASYHIYDTGNKKVLKKTCWFNMIYSGKEHPKPQVEENISSVEWCNSEKLKRYRSQTYESLKKYFV